MRSSGSRIALVLVAFAAVTAVGLGFVTVPMGHQPDDPAAAARPGRRAAMRVLVACASGYGTTQGIAARMVGRSS
jgi:hypothetical protein